jgi:secondary thiamine-phosphate synthase enzyme
MKILTKTLSIETRRQFEILDVTDRVQSVLGESGIQHGICVVFCPHTTTAVKINHNEPLLIQDIMKTLYRLVPADVNYSHDLFELRQNTTPNERSNGHAHIKSFLLGPSENVIVQQGKLILGAKQSLFFVEFDGGRSRQLLVHIMGD